MPYEFLGFTYRMHYCNMLVQSLLQPHPFLKKEFFEKVLKRFFGGFNVLIKTTVILMFLTVFFNALRKKFRIYSIETLKSCFKKIV